MKPEGCLLYKYMLFFKEKNSTVIYEQWDKLLSFRWDRFIYFYIYTALSGSVCACRMNCKISVLSFSKSQPLTFTAPLYEMYWSPVENYMYDDEVWNMLVL